ncbi:hypothetical protein [Terriglobus aquaticus]|uniref:Fibronectin type-III domain-containing protein n=1 Tax=Terriglobus aquaticus TaxID=940139 RepID=A0ABW9KEV9_9BACT|nr:hypothetical protein [Terriglobus aquaticus]
MAKGLSLLWLGGCASPGVPRPPSLHLPAPVRDLSAVREGGSVLLHFTAPDETTDHQPLSHKGTPMPLVAEVCRVQGAACAGFAQLRVAPGQAVDTADALPPPLTLGPGRAVLYRVRVSNPAGRDAGYSKPVAAVAGAAPAAVSGLTAATVSQGVQLTWMPEGQGKASVRVEAWSDTPASAPAFGVAPARSRADAMRLLQVPAGQADPGGAIDPAPAAGARVRYRVYRERSVTVDGQTLSLRGSAAEVRTTRSADVFPPGVPNGLLAVSFPSETGASRVSLSWEPNSEPDVVGYRVYRAIGAGAFVRASGAADVPGVTFEDTAANGLPAGSRVRYAVTAVDRSGNESARSAVTSVDVP